MKSENACSKALEFETVRTHLNATVPEFKGHFKACPGCGDTLQFESVSPTLWIVEDIHLEAGWFVIKGWLCGRMVFGTIVMYGVGESGYKLVTDHGNSYITDLTGRTVRDY